MTKAIRTFCMTLTCLSACFPTRAFSEAGSAKAPAPFKTSVAPVTLLVSTEAGAKTHYSLITAAGQSTPVGLQKFLNEVKQWKRETRFVITPTHKTDFYTISDTINRLNRLGFKTGYSCITIFGAPTTPACREVSRYRKTAKPKTKP